MLKSDNILPEAEAARQQSNIQKQRADKIKRPSPLDIVFHSSSFDVTPTMIEARISKVLEKYDK